MSHASTTRGVARSDARTPAQWYCLLAGLALLLAGILGFISDSSFDTGDGVQGDSFLGFEVNAIHNLIHLASGLVLLAASRRRGLARSVAIGFGVVYGAVATATRSWTARPRRASSATECATAPGTSGQAQPDPRSSAAAAARRSSAA